MEKDTQSPHEENQIRDVRTLLSWSAPGRPYRARGKQFYLSILLIVLFVEVILFLFSEYQLMVVVMALAFLSIVLSSVPPKNFHYKITTEGVKVEDYFYIWSELYDFFFKRIEGTDVLIIRTEAFLPGELKLSLGVLTRDHVRQTVVNFLPYREFVKPTFMENAADWLSRNFPLENLH